MKFVDLNTGSVYNGDLPYIHWFDDKQSTNLVYIKKLCVVDTQEKLNIKLNSSIFKLIDVSRLDTLQTVNINDFSYKDIKDMRVDGEYESIGELYDLDLKKVYLHMIYIEASSSVEGEFLEDFYINNQKFTIGASFWPEYEPHKINLGNFGVEIPEDVTRAIYETNVHEESIDYITLNRKRKELLMNYWDIIASKGSYKSLYDSLKWFEYGDLVHLQEFWQNSDDRLFQQDITQILNDNIKSYLNNYSKTTYIGLYAALNKIKVEDGKVKYEKKVNLIDEVKDEDGNVLGALTHAVLNEALPEDESMDQIFQIGYDDVFIDDDSFIIEEPESKEFVDPSDWKRVTYEEYNGVLGEEVPELVKSAIRWGIEDLSLKMYLLGNFYETYFMPIHLDLIHSTIEHIVFANTIKILQQSNICRHDYVNNFGSFECNVKDGDSFYLENVSCQVNNNTPLGIQWEGQSEYSIRPIGVDNVINDISNDNELKTFMTQYYDGIGKIINFKCNINVEDENDPIKASNIVITKKNSNYVRSGSFKLLKSPDENAIADLEFNLLFEEEGQYKIELSFTSLSGIIYTRIININILDDTGRTLKVYKVMRNTKEEHYDMISPSSYIFTSYRGVDSTKTFTLVGNPEGDGIGFQRLLVYEIVDINNMSDIIKDNFDVIRQTEKYIYLLSKHFDKDDTDVSKVSSSFGKLKRDTYVYIPQNHHLEEIGGEKPEDYQVSRHDTLMIVPDIKYLKQTNETQWVVENISRKNFTKPLEIKYANRPHIAGKKYTNDTGYYNIKFTYMLGSEVQEISLNSAFQVI